MKRNILADTYTSSTVNSCSSSSDVWLLTAVAVKCDLIYSRFILFTRRYLFSISYVRDSPKI